MLFYFKFMLFYASFAFSSCTKRLGEVHTSVAQISQLVLIENEIISVLKTHLKEEEERLQFMKRYVEDWNEVEPEEIVGNPLSSYHFLQRVSEDFKHVEASLSHSNSLRVLNTLHKIRSNLIVPEEEDVNGAAWALVRLQDVYNLTIEDMIQGTVHGVPAKKGLTATDCLRFGEQSFKNLEFELSEKWTRKGLEMLESRNASSSEEQTVEQIKNVLVKRQLMRRLVTEIAQNSNEEIIDRFSGLGIPVSFQKKIHWEAEANSQLTVVEDNYRRLCRGEDVQELPFKGLSCGYLTGDRSLYRLLMPFKIELVWPDPIMFIYHDVLNKHETSTLRNLAYPKLETTQVHSFTSHSAMKSLARVGKTAWLHNGDSPLVDKLLRRVEHMTGLSTKFTEDFHILNYGVGGHYDVHVDFFDLFKKNMDPEPHHGDRFATVLFYLNDVTAGGATVFPTLGLRIPAIEGSAVLWFNLKRNGKGDYRTLHASCPVLLGQKWIANLWLHEFGQEFRWPCTTDPEE